MRIAVDATSVPLRPAGAGVYAIELLRALAAREGRRDGYAVFARGAWADEIAPGRRDWRIERVAARSRPERTAWEQLRLPGRLSALGIDVLHSTHHTLPLRLRARTGGGRTKRVVTVHDVTFLRIPQRYPLARRLYMEASTRLAVRVADAIIVPSRAVRDDVLRMLSVPDGRVHVVYEAAAPRFTLDAAARGAGVDAPYILSVGSLEPGKNRGRLIRALRALRAEGLPQRLVIAGQPAWKYHDDYALVRELGMTDAVTFLGYVPDERLPALYAGADAFAGPSLYEGFGLPVLEAMACGVPVVTSATGATAEVAGDAAVLVDPLSMTSIADGLRSVLWDEARRRELRERGLQRAGEFSWTRAADETHAVYERLVAGCA